MKNNRTSSFIVVAVGYVIAALVGVAAFYIFSGGFVLRIFLADVAATLAIYVLSLIFDNASFYDPYWSVQPPVILILAAVYLGVSDIGTLLILVAVTYWGVRLTANWAYTFKSLNAMDWRYAMLKEKSKRLYFLVNLFGIQLFPTCVVYLCILPALKFIELGGGFSPLMLAGIVVSLSAATLQLVSDMQMHRFRAKNTGGLIRDGLWKNARHPNYLGEILMWWGLYFAVITVFPSLWRFCIGPLVNTLMFLFISIPMAEKRQSQKPGFEEYKHETRMLLPIKR